MRKAGFDLWEMENLWKEKREHKRKSKRDYAYREGGFMNARLWHTDIAKINFPERKMVISTGGYQTTTTKARLNKLLPSGYGISQKKYKWWLREPSGKESEFRENHEIRW